MEKIYVSIVVLAAVFVSGSVSMQYSQSRSRSRSRSRLLKQTREQTRQVGNGNYFTCKASSPTDKPVFNIDSRPPVAVSHIFCGEIKGNTAQGFHAIPQNVVISKNPQNVNLSFAEVGKLRGDKMGRRTPVSDFVRINKHGQWVLKEKIECQTHYHYFPNILSYSDVVNLLRGAYNKCYKKGTTHYAVTTTIRSKGVSKLFFVMYVQPVHRYGESITTAFACAPNKCTANLRQCTYNA